MKDFTLASIIITLTALVGTVVWLITAYLRQRNIAHLERAELERMEREGPYFTSEGMDFMDKIEQDFNRVLSSAIDQARGEDREIKPRYIQAAARVAAMYIIRNYKQSPVTNELRLVNLENEINYDKLDI